MQKFATFNHFSNCICTLSPFFFPNFNIFLCSIRAVNFFLLKTCFGFLGIFHQGQGWDFEGGQKFFRYYIIQSRIEEITERFQMIDFIVIYERLEQDDLQVLEGSTKKVQLQRSKITSLVTILTVTKVVINLVVLKS
eukprot:TRINITY_DN26188_c0_g1_i3.p2 TRINITY_DN26188_c0_g1~~TRINITY_DN26188_c0_g1_i3.p2  ORF type:complete len:137 (+),score=1.73 TRINITY_DN26188_c0_g1_i3:452-862(+)